MQLTQHRTIMISPMITFGFALLTAMGSSAFAQQTLLVADFATGLEGFTIDNSFGDGNGLWQRTNLCQAALPGHSGPWALYYGVTSICQYNAGRNEGVVTSPAVNLVGVQPPITLTFNYWLESEGDPNNFDAASVEVAAGAGSFVPVAHASTKQGVVVLQDPSITWLSSTVNLSAWAGNSIRVRFRFRTFDDQFNDFPGFYVDDVRITGTLSSAPVLANVYQRRTHGPAGSFDQIFPLGSTGLPGIEARSGGLTEIVLGFSEPIQAGDGTLNAGDEVQVSQGQITALQIEGNLLRVSLSGLTAKTCVRLTVEGGSGGIVNQGGVPMAGNVEVRIGYLPGDRDQDGNVNIFDLLSVRSQLNQPVLQGNFRNDVIPDGTITIFDLLSVRAGLNSSLPACP